MADPGQLLDALRQADAAGDTAGAQRLAQLYKAASATPAASPKSPSFLDDLGSTFSGAVDATGRDMTRLGQVVTGRRPADMTARPVLPKTIAVKDIPANAFGAYADRQEPIARVEGSLLGDAAGLIFSPVAAAANHYIIEPGAQALDKLGPGTKPATLTLDNGRLVTSKPQRMTPAEQHASNRGAMNLGITLATAPLLATPLGRAGAAADVADAAQATRVAAPNAFAAKAAAFDRAGVDPSIAAIAGGGAAKVANAAAENPLGIRPRAAMRKQVGQTATTAGDIAAGYGDVSSKPTMGEGLQQAISDYSKGTGAKLPPDVARADSSAKLSFGDKADALYGRAERLIGDPSAPIQLKKTLLALADAAEPFSSDALNQRFGNPVLRGLAEDVLSAKGKFTWQDAALMRSKIRQRLLADPALRGTADDAAVGKLYTALTDDLRDGATQIAAKTGGLPAAMKAGRAWDQANTFYRTGRARMDDALNSVFSAPSGESAYDRVMAAAGTSSKADIRKLVSLKRSVPSDQWGDLAATVVDGLGKPSAGAADQAGFSVANFVSNYAKLSPQGREVLFGATSGGGAKATSLKAELDNLATVAGHLKAVEKGANASNTGTAVQTALTVGGLANPFAHVTAGPVLAALGGLQITGEMMTNPTAVRWLANMGKAAKAGPQAVRSQAGRLRIAAKANAALIPLSEAVEHSLLPAPASAPALAAPTAADEQPQ